MGPAVDLNFSPGTGIMARETSRMGRRTTPGSTNGLRRSSHRGDEALSGAPAGTRTNVGVQPPVVTPISSSNIVARGRRAPSLSSAADLVKVRCRVPR